MNWRRLERALGDDPLGPARGVIIGALLSAPIWFAIAWVVKR